MANQLGFYQNSDICIGCKACMVSCKDKNNLPLGEKFRKVYDYANCEWEVTEDGVAKAKDVYAYSVSMACNHCENPACVSVCPTAAMQKREDGIVFSDQELCIGCGSCVSACPYEVPYISAETKKSRKCDFCKDLIDQGEVPYCVAACSMRCLEYGEIEELRAEHGDTATVAPIVADTGTGPSTVYTESRLYLGDSVPGTLTTTDEELLSETV